MHPLTILLGILGMLMLTCGVSGYLFLQSEQGRKLVAGAREAVALVEEAAQAPGAAELRDLGCDQALITTVGRMSGVLGTFLEKADLDLGDEVSDETMLVICNMQGSRGGPGCASIASAYVAATDPAAPFVVLSGDRSGPERSACQGLYDRYGDKLKELDL